MVLSWTYALLHSPCRARIDIWLRRWQVNGERTEEHRLFANRLEDRKQARWKSSHHHRVISMWYWRTRRCKVEVNALSDSFELPQRISSLELSVRLTIHWKGSTLWPRPGSSVMRSVASIATLECVRKWFCVFRAEHLSQLNVVSAIHYFDTLGLLSPDGIIEDSFTNLKELWK